MDDIKIVIQPPETTKIIVSTVASPLVANERIFPFANQQIVVAEHFFGRLVTVTIWNTQGLAMMGEVQQISLNQVIVSFNQPLSGKIIIK